MSDPAAVYQELFPASISKKERRRQKARKRAAAKAARKAARTTASSSGSSSNSNSDEDTTAMRKARKKSAKTSAKTKEEPSATRIRMTPALEVLAQIRWNPNLDGTWLIGVEDRFAGIQDQSLEQWDDGLDGEVGGGSIPSHRIKYFKRDGVIVWDRRDTSLTIPEFLEVHPAA